MPSVESDNRRGGPEEQQRHGGGRPGEHQQPQRGPAAAACPGRRDAGEIRQRRRGQQQRLHAEAEQGVHADDLAHEAVQGVGRGERHGDPRQPPHHRRQRRHAEEGDGNAHRLPRPQPLAKQEHAEEDGKQRAEEIAQRRLDQLAAGDGVDEHQPGGGQQEGACGEQGDDLRFPQFPPHVPPSSQCGDHQNKHDERPERAVRQHDRRLDVGQRLEVEGNESRHRVGGDAVEQSVSRRAGVHESLGGGVAKPPIITHAARGRHPPPRLFFQSRWWNLRMICHASSAVSTVRNKARSPSAIVPSSAKN